MKLNRFIFLNLFCLILLTGCVSREQADAKLAKACQAAVDVFLEDSKIDHIYDSKFSASPIGTDFRHVIISTIIVDGWIEIESDFECVFQESFGLFNSGYAPAIEQVRVDDILIGRSGGEILGNPDDFVKLTDAVRKSLYEDK